MQHIGEKIKGIISSSNLSAYDVADRLGISFQYLYSLFKKESIETSYLFKLSDILKVPVESFLCDEESGKWNKQALVEEVERLDKEIKDLWNRIDELMETIRAKRSILRLTYYQLKSLQDNRLDEILKAIDEAEKFEETDSVVRQKRLALDLGTNSIGVSIINVDKGAFASSGSTIHNRENARNRRRSGANKNPIVERVINNLSEIHSNILKLNNNDKDSSITKETVIKQMNEFIKTLE